MQKTWPLWASLFLWGAGTAQAVPLADYLAAVQQHPALQSARAGIRATDAQLSALSSPILVTAQGGFGRSELKAALPDPWVTSKQLSVAATFTPILYGDSADTFARAQTGRQQAVSGYRQAMINLQIQAVLASSRQNLAEEGLKTAQQGESIALQLLEASRLQQQRGLIAPSALRQAEHSYQEAQERSTSAAENVTLAKAAVRMLLGAELTLDPTDWDAVLPVPTGRSAEQDQADITLKNAQMAVNTAERNLIPVVSVGYNNSLTDTLGLALSIDSRAFQPKATLSYQDPNSNNTLKQSFQLGLGLAITPAAFDGIAAAQQQIQSAQAQVGLAQQNAQLQLQSLNMALTQSGRQLSLKQQALRNAEQALDEQLARQKAGLISPLEPLKALGDTYAAKMGVLQAETDRLSKLTDIYRYVQVPLVEVLL